MCLQELNWMIFVPLTIGIPLYTSPAKRKVLLTWCSKFIEFYSLYSFYWIWYKSNYVCDSFSYKVVVKIKLRNIILESYGLPQPNKKAAQDSAVEGAVWYLKSLDYSPFKKVYKGSNNNLVWVDPISLIHK